MPSLDDIRTAAEGRLDRILVKLDRRHRALVIGAVRQFGSVEMVPQAIWDEIQQDIENETAAALLALILVSDDWTRGQIRRQSVPMRGPSPADVARYGTVAAFRAQQLAADRLGSVRNRMAQALQELGDVRKAASEAFAEVARSREVVSTTTDTITLGQRAVGRAANGAATSDGQEVEVEMIWVTERDAKVCPICAPLDATAENVWGGTQPNGPPAHPNCRCHLMPLVTATDRPASPRPRSRPAYTIGQFEVVGAA